MLRLTFILVLFITVISSNLSAQNLSPAILKQIEVAEKAMFDATSNGDSLALKN